MFPVIVTFLQFIGINQKYHSYYSDIPKTEDTVDKYGIIIYHTR